MTVAPQPSIFAELSCLWICTSSSPDSGFGHVGRSLVIAEALRDWCAPIFLLDPDDHWSKSRIKDKHCSIFSEGIEKAWEVLPDPDAILIDTRLSDGLDGLIATAKTRNIPVISIHDLGLNMLPSNIIIDGSIVPADSDSMLPDAKYFAGTDYMVLDPIYRRLYLQNKPIREKIKSIFINLGGGDSGKYYWKVLEGLRLWARDVEVTGVPGFVAWGQDILAQQDWSPLHFHWESRDVDRYLFQSDLAITAGGIAAYEALCAGTPLLALSYDRLQQTTVGKLSYSKACIDLGPGDELLPVDLARVLSLIETDVNGRRCLSCHGRHLVDGQGSERVARIIGRSLAKSSQPAVRGCS